ncbi:MAG: polysaccharide pyruvyl transferase CsaB [Clostridia bacterium]|nr:polysaccharide pyruvyl transferase CsaB [Clostridia bacterium]
MIKLLIAGYHGFGNCGDEAILKAMTTNIRCLAGDIDITALSHKPEFTKTEYGIKSVQRFNVFQVVSAIKNSDIMLSGGGTLLQNGTSTRSLIYYLSIIKLAKLFGKRVMLYANGIGPVTGKFNQSLVRTVINTVDVITLREKLSEADLRSLGVSNPNVTVTADAAFKLQSITDERAEELLRAEGFEERGRKRVGISVRAWSKAKFGEDYISKLAKACDNIADTGKEIIFIPMQFPGDIAISKKVSSMMKNKSYILTSRYTPAEILGIVGRVDAMVSMRLHTLIFAAVKNIPMVGIIYDPKIEYYLKELDMPEGGDVRKEKLDSDKITSITMDIFENMNRYKGVLKSKADMMTSKADENDILLAQLIDTIRKEKERKRK